MPPTPPKNTETAPAGETKIKRPRKPKPEGYEAITLLLPSDVVRALELLAIEDDRAAQQYASRVLKDHVKNN